MVEFAASFRRHGPAYRAKYKDRMLPSHRATMAAIEQCRTETLGGHVSQCTACGAWEYRYHSCQHRPCPQCQNAAATHWVEKQRALLLPVPYCLVTFPLPEARRPAARSHQTLLYTLLFQPSAAALKALAWDPKDLGGHIGLVGGLHTWTRELAYHPHSHALVPGGALASDGLQWLSPRSPDWLVPVHALSRLFRGKCRAALTTTGLLTPVPPQVWSKGWMTHCQAAGTGTELRAYFAPSLSRVAITINRLEKLANGPVTCRVKERESTAWTSRTLPAEEFIRRFLQHVLPKRFSKVRYCGFLSPRRRSSLAQIRPLLAACPHHDSAATHGHTWERPKTALAPEEALHCRKGGGQLVFLVRLSPTKRGPPS